MTEQVVNSSGVCMSICMSSRPCLRDVAEFAAIRCLLPFVWGKYHFLLLSLFLLLFVVYIYFDLMVHFLIILCLFSASRVPKIGSFAVDGT